MRRLVELSLCVAVTALLVADRAAAQPLFAGVRSLDCTVLEAHTLVVGQLVEFGLHQSDDQDESTWLTLAVDRTLRGPHRRRLSLRLSDAMALASRWQAPDARLLVAAVPQADAPPGAAQPLIASAIIDLSDPKLEVLTADLTVLRMADDVLCAAEHLLRRADGKKPPATFVRHIAPGSLGDTRWAPYHGLQLEVPADQRLENWAHQAIGSDDFMRRCEAVRALRHFPSDENIARLKALLNDSGWSYFHRAEDNLGVEVRHYTVRQEAYETLRLWGVSVPQPVVREEVLKFESVTTVSMFNQKITDDDLRGLARFENLEQLFLWGAKIRDAQLALLAERKNLRELYLAGTTISDAGLPHLAALHRLEYLDLAATRVSDAGLRVLAALPRLRKVDLSRTGVTYEGVAALRAARPNLQIESTAQPTQCQ